LLFFLLFFCCFFGVEYKNLKDLILIATPRAHARRRRSAIVPRVLGAERHGRGR
jgi:hypothetical protein